MEAIRSNQDNKGPQAPDVIDIGLAFGPRARKEGLLQPYKVSTCDEILPDVKVPHGHWYVNNDGVMAFGVNKDLMKNAPADWADLTKPDYASSVAQAADGTECEWPHRVGPWRKEPIEAGPTQRRPSSSRTTTPSAVPSEPSSSDKTMNGPSSPSRKSPAASSASAPSARDMITLRSNCRTPDPCKA